MDGEVENIFVDKELLQSIRDVRDRATRIETNLKRIEIKVRIMVWTASVSMVLVIITFGVLLASLIGKELSKTANHM